MNPTLKNNETIYVNKCAYGLVNPFGANLLIKWSEPHENDIVIYLYNNNLVVKRCVATENSTLDYLTNSSYILLVNLTKQILPSYWTIRDYKPEGYILAVGDNYTESFDSRNYGFIPVTNILGKVICR